MAIITLDFETYYDRDYSLSKLTYEAYVRDERFEPILLSVHNQETNELYAVRGEANIAKELDQLELHKHMQVAHNNAFDAFILGDYFKVECGMYGCTMNMARVVHNAKGSMSLANLAKRHKLKAKGTTLHDMLGIRGKDMSASQWDAYEDYCLGDSEICTELYHIFRPHFIGQDMNLISETIRWGAVPKYVLDTPLLEQYLRELATQRELRLEHTAQRYNAETTAFRGMLRSPQTFAEMLRELGVEVPMKVNDKGKATYAFAKTDVAFQELGEHPDKRVSDLYECKVETQSSIAETRAQRFLEISRRGCMPFPLVPFKAHTGRHGATQKINTQNLPKRGGDKTLRRAMCAPKDHAVLTCDLSQVEARRLAALAGQADIVEQFAQGIDVYSEFGTGFYGRKIDKSTYTERSISKEAVLSLGFGAGHVSFQDRLKGAYGIDISIDDAQSLVKYYRTKNANIVAFWKQCDRAVTHMYSGLGTYQFGMNDELSAERGKLILADGWELYFDDLKLDDYDDYGRPKFSYFSHHHKHRKSIYSGLVANNVTQGSAGRIFQWQLLQLRKRGRLMSGAVHDEYNSIVHFKDIFDYYDDMTSIMRTAPKWAQGTPIDCEFEIGLNYGDQMELKQFIEQHYDSLIKFHSVDRINDYLKV